jgi:hypothetical protein
MTFYSYERLYVLSGGNSDLIVTYFNNLVRNIDLYSDLVGGSFIVNEKIITRNPYRLSNQVLAEYLGILSFRNYASYKFTRNPDLSIELLPPWVPKSVVENNPLIEIKQPNLKFSEEIIYV